MGAFVLRHRAPLAIGGSVVWALGLVLAGLDGVGLGWIVALALAWVVLVAALVAIVSSARRRTGWTAGSILVLGGDRVVRADLRRPARLQALLVVMARRGSGVVLSYGEDTERWEASWITGGRRHVGVAGDPLAAVDRAYLAARTSTAR